MTRDKFVWLLLDNASKYFIIAAPFFLLFYVLLRKRWLYKKIQTKFPKISDYAREMGFSAISVIIFSFPPLIMLYSDSIRPNTTYYEDINKYGILYFILCFPFMLIIHDTYFYWAHRLMHHPKIFRLFHLIHHKSTNPSPWAAYAFHPFEAVIEALIFPILLLTIPIHNIHLMSFFVFSLVYNVYGHLGYELFPKGFSRNWFGKWLNTSVCHNQHHQHFKGNYGLYFTIWDRLMGTLRDDYDDKYDDAKNRKPVL